MNATVFLLCRAVPDLWLGVWLSLFAWDVPAATTLVPAHSNWSYLADGSDQGTLWQDPFLDDSGWSNGVARLGFGNDGETTSIGSATNEFVTFYFRHSFFNPGTNDFTQVQARLWYDDGAVVYLNGVELFRQNMPADEITYLTLASTTVMSTSEPAMITTNLPAAIGLLQPGLNVLAVEVHQSAITSSDISFDIELTATTGPMPPTIADTTQPSGGVVAQGDSFKLAVVARSSSPLRYQWFFQQGADAFQPISGATNDVYTITNMQFDDAGSYYARVSNSFGATSSPVAIVKFAADIAPPIVVSVSSITNNRIGVCFDDTVTPASATDLANYTVDAGLVSVTNVVLRSDGKSVELFLGSPVDEFYSVAVTNVLDLAGNAAAEIKTGYTSPYSSTTVGTQENPSPVGSVFTCFWDTFDVTVGGDIGGTNDHFQFIDQTVVGDFDVRVRVTRLDPAAPFSKAGLMARETLEPGSRTIQTYFTPIEGANQIEVAVRAVPGGETTDEGFQVGPRAPANPLRWLRMTRTNDVFTTYHGTNASDWVLSGMTTQAFSLVLHVGLAAASQSASPALRAGQIVAASQGNGSSTTASFTDFFVQGAQPGDDIVPTLTASVDSVNLLLQWNATPRDFAVEVSTDLIEWSLVLLPVRQDAGGFSMDILRAPGESQLFARLVRVGNVIVASQPKSVTAGLILSPGSGLTPNTTGGSSFCANPTPCDDPAYPVNVPSVFKQAGTKVNIPNTATAAVDTILSGTSVDTVLQVRNLLNLACPKCSDDAPSLGNKSLVKPLPVAASPTSRNYTILVGASQSAAFTTPIQVYITY